MIDRFKELTERELPRRAREGKWPIRFDHCFKRICLDNAVGDTWHKHIPRPAQRHLREPELSKAIAIAEQILAGGLPVLHQLDCNSLRWRGKTGKRLSSLALPGR